jgi:hypothetical protein
MAFNSANLVLAFSGNGRAGAANPVEYHGKQDHPFIWEYNGGSDVLADLDGGSGYFTNPYTLPLRTGDLIMATFFDGKALYRVENMNPGAGPNMYVLKLADVSSFGSMTTFVGG